MTVEAEGVVKYRLDFTPGPALPADCLAPLIAWQRTLHRLGLVGRDPARYGGLAYGNLSLRLADGGFAISATQTADVDRPTPDHYARVTAWDCAGNHIVATGPAPPSSESLTHAALYDADPAIGCVQHVHAPAIWANHARLGLAGTAADVAYGTPAMAAEVARLYRAQGFSGQGVLVMGGHTDGVLAFGPDADAAGQALMRVLERAATSG